MDQLQIIPVSILVGIPVSNMAITNPSLDLFHEVNESLQSIISCPMNLLNPDANYVFVEWH